MNQLQSAQRTPAIEEVYAQLDKTAADFLRVRERNIRQAMDNAATEVGRELKKAQDMLAGRNQYNGFFEKWYTAMGFKKQTVYNLIHRYIFIHEIDDEQRRQLIEALPLSLTYEISKPTANEKAVQAVLNGDIKTTKEYRELVKRLEEEKKAREEAEQRAKEAEQYAKEKEREAIQAQTAHNPQDVEKIRRLEQENKEMDATISKLYARLHELERLERSVKHERQSPLYDMYRKASVLNIHLQVFLEDVHGARLTVANSDRDVIDKVRDSLKLTHKLTEQLLELIEGETKTIINAKVIEIVPEMVG